MLHDIDNSQPPPNDAYPVTAKPQASSKLHLHPSPSLLRCEHIWASALVSQEPQVSRVPGLPGLPAAWPRMDGI
ncbi:hypothetical protein E4U14_004858 [Claviceps sp. LM454 group G7]|nr:hypothetical protein E4U14_004858 [Claviceps sp. LM454 group G7]